METKCFWLQTGPRQHRLHGFAFVAMASLQIMTCAAATAQTARMSGDWPFDRSASAIQGDDIKQWALVLDPGSDPARVVAGLGARLVRVVGSRRSAFLIEFDGAPPKFDALRRRAQAFPEIQSLEPQVPLPLTLNATPKDPLLALQWNLVNRSTTNADIDISPVWSMTTGSPPVPINGSGVLVGVVDSGFDYTHPDLSAAYAPAESYDAFGHPLDVPSNAPNTINCVTNGSAKFCHGTVVAGVIGETENTFGGVGVAPGVAMADQRLIYGGNPTPDSVIAATEAFMANPIAAKNNSWAYCSLGLYVGGIDAGHFQCGRNNADRLLPIRFGSLTLNTLFDITNSTGNLKGRGGLGEVVTFAAGNDADPPPLFNGADRAHERAKPNDPTYAYVGDWAGYRPACNRYVLAVGATNHSGTVANYSDPGPCILVVAPGGENVSTKLGIVATDLRGLGNGYNAAADASGGDYTLSSPPEVVGTSFAAPAVAGVAALVLQVNPRLDYRDVMHILVNTARKIDPTNPSWYQNGAGRWVSRDYGFGLIDAAAAVKQAKTWTNVPSLTSYVPTQTCHNIPIPHNATGVTFGFNITSRIKIEHAEILIGALDPNPGNLQIKVQSPTGKQAVVIGVPQQNRREADLFYLFTTTNFWDELSAGFWRVTVVNAIGHESGTFACAAINLYGAPY